MRLHAIKLLFYLWGGSKLSTFSRPYKAHARGRGLNPLARFLNSMKNVDIRSYECSVSVADTVTLS